VTSGAMWADLAEEDSMIALDPVLDFAPSPVQSRSPDLVPLPVPSLVQISAPEFVPAPVRISAPEEQWKRSGHDKRKRNVRGRGNHRPQNRSVPETRPSIWIVPLSMQFFSPIFLDSPNNQSQGVHASLMNLKASIHTVSPWPDVWRQAIEANWVLGRINQACSLKPFSRAFFKLIELNAHLCLIPPKTVVPSFSVVLLGEAPGGFVHGVSWCRSLNLDDGPWQADCSTDMQVVSLPEDTWPEPLCRPEARSRVHRLNMVKAVEQREAFVEKFRCTADLVTADGGFEVQQDRRHEQELEMLPLITSEIDIALKVLKPGGTLLIKFFAIDQQKTRDLLIKIKDTFEKVLIVIPVASKPSNDERYVVAQGFFDGPRAPEPGNWGSWFDHYAFEDKLRQREPLSKALDLCRVMTMDSRLPLEPALGNAKSYCTELGLPVKFINK